MDWSQRSSLKCINCFERSFPSLGRNTLCLHDWSLYDMSVKVLARDDHTLRASSQFSETFCSSLPFLLVTNLIASQVDNKSVLSPPCGAADALFIQLMRIWDFQANCGGILRGLHHFCNVSPTPACFRQSGVWISNAELCPFSSCKCFALQGSPVAILSICLCEVFLVLISVRGKGNLRGLSDLAKGITYLALHQFGNDKTQVHF